MSGWYRQEGDVEDHEMEEHGEDNGKDQRGIGPEGKGEETFILTETIHGVKHFNGDQNGE